MFASDIWNSMLYRTYWSCIPHTSCIRDEIKYMLIELALIDGLNDIHCTDNSIYKHAVMCYKCDLYSKNINIALNLILSNSVSNEKNLSVLMSFLWKRISDINSAVGLSKYVCVKHNIYTSNVICRLPEIDVHFAMMLHGLCFSTM